MSSEKNFVSHVLNAFLIVNKKTTGVPSLEGLERQFRHALAQHIFGEVLGWEGHYAIGEVLDITCFDDEGFPIIIVETKGPGVELTREVKERLRRRLEEFGSVKFGVLATPSKFMIYGYEDYKLREIAKINVASSIFLAKEKLKPSGVERKQILRLEMLKRQRLVWLEDPAYFERTYKEISVAKGEGVRLLVQNLRNIVKNLTAVMMNFFTTYWKREDYSGRFLQRQFNDWLKHSLQDEQFKRGNKKERRKIIEVFCRETAYVLVGRILFTRICEDKDILKPLILSGEGLAESLRFYEKRKRENVYLLVFYGSLEVIKRYYSHLHELGFFDWWWLSPDKRGLLNPDDKMVQNSLEEDLNYEVKKILRKLNRFDFTQVDRDILGDVYQGYLPPDERKRLGEFYTPKEVIEFILDFVGYKPTNEIRGKRILDPACGSGGFLVESIQRLIECYRRTGSSLKDPDDAKQIIQESINLIYGLDIHPFACFIAEMNLLFQLVDLYNVVRQKYQHYELPRLNIYRTDSLAPPGEATAELTDFMDNSRRKALIEEAKGANNVKNIKFDFIVANPPYVTGIAEGGKIPQEYKLKLKKFFRDIHTKANDLAVYFLALGIKLLNPGGQFGYIVTGQFMKARYGQYVNAHIALKTTIKQLVDVRNSDVFREVSNYPILLFLENSEDKGTIRVCEVIKDLEGETWNERLKNTIDHIRRNIVKEHYEDEYMNCFEFNQHDLTSLVQKEKIGERYLLKNWIVAPSARMSILSKLIKKSNCFLEDLCEVHEGLHTGLHKRIRGKTFDPFIVDEETLIRYNLEKKLLRPVLERSGFVKRYKIFWNRKHLIYITKDTDITKYPNIKEHLTSFKEDLSRRKEVQRGTVDWYELKSPKRMEYFVPNKIITPDISNINNFAFDRVGYYVLNTCYVILPKESHEFFSKESESNVMPFLNGILNSNVSEFFIKHISPHVRGRYYRYKQLYLNQIPIRLPSTLEEKSNFEEIIQRVNQILRFNEQIQRIKEKIETFPNSYFESDWSFNRLMNVVKARSLSKSSYTISEKKLRTDYFRELTGKEIFRIILDTGEYVDFYSEDVASYVFEVLKTKTITTKRELLELKIPSGEYLRSILYQNRRDRDQIHKNEKTVEELEKQINDLVYKLYDITYKEGRIIEEYLAKF